MTAMPVDVQLAENVLAPAVDIERFGETAIAEVAPEGELCIRVVGLAESESFNAEYRGQNKPTNVLSFPANIKLPDSDVDLLGDLVICAPVVEAEAREQGRSLTDHYAHMVVHGVLHLVGYDHEHVDDAQVMETKEVSILAGLGVADPYADTR